MVRKKKHKAAVGNQGQHHRGRNQEVSSAGQQSVHGRSRSRDHSHSTRSPPRAQPSSATPSTSHGRRQVHHQPNPSTSSAPSSKSSNRTPKTSPTQSQHRNHAENRNLSVNSQRHGRSNPRTEQINLPNAQPTPKTSPTQSQQRNPAENRNFSGNAQRHGRSNSRTEQINLPNAQPSQRGRRRRREDRRRVGGRRAGRQPWRDHSAASATASSAAGSSSSSTSDGGFASTAATGSVTSPGASTSSSTSTLGRDLPGFYFDPIKKKYFRILPGHQATGPSTVTRDSIRQKLSEDARQQSLRDFALRTIQHDFGSESGSQSSHPKRCAKSNNIANHVFSVQTGTLNTRLSMMRQDKIIFHQLKRLQASCKQKVLAAALGPGQGKVEHMTRILATPNYINQQTARMVCLWSLKTLLVQRIQLLEVNRVAKVDGSAIIDSSPIGAVLTPSLSKVTDMCWALKAPRDETACPVLYTTTCIMGTNPSLAKIRHLDPGVAWNQRESTGERMDTEFHLGRKQTWACAWCPHSKKFSVGLEQAAVVLDVTTRRLWEYYTKKSDVLAQTFSNNDGNTLFSGTRRGEILMHDLRSISTHWTGMLKHRSPLSHLHMMQSDNHLLASDFGGRLCMWDLRMRRVVQEYEGHDNQYVRIPFTLDPQEKVICSAGQDCYTRVWDIRTRELLVTIPPPYPASRDLIPAVTVYASPTGHMDRPSVLMGVKDELHLYTS